MSRYNGGSGSTGWVVAAMVVVVVIIGLFAMGGSKTNTAVSTPKQLPACTVEERPNNEFLFKQDGCEGDKGAMVAKFFADHPGAQIVVPPVMKPGSRDFSLIVR